MIYKKIIGFYNMYFDICNTSKVNCDWIDVEWWKVEIFVS